MTTTKNRILAGTTAALLIVTSLYIVFVTRIGPVILVISASHGHGVHTGDLITIPMGLAALYLTYRAIRRK